MNSSLKQTWSNMALSAKIQQNISMQNSTPAGALVHDFPTLYPASPNGRPTPSPLGWGMVLQYFLLFLTKFHLKSASMTVEMLHLYYTATRTWNAKRSPEEGGNQEGGGWGSNSSEGHTLRCRGLSLLEACNRGPVCVNHKFLLILILTDPALTRSAAAPRKLVILLLGST